ncbi:methyltransferase domain-containing protein [Roseobacter sinensis]|uniref:Methyltransferase domain-containing protein n=1 Tax=Roseobacter sinensis TaxID=2931391 RepID=A0ABT3BDN8_9RHOB|nr:methyltransferase domain-containing protein [Roseobacter sp. WL0113]MCV3271283.1 methyltransferase domain-containing protein [Roseobacter sp. WL0113]
MTLVDYKPPDLVPLYDRLASSYDRLHRRWLRHAGGEAQAALEAAVRAFAAPDARLLDAGCGTGAFARRLVAEGFAPNRLTLLDPSEAMLQRCTDIPSDKVLGRLEAMPFEDHTFDVLTCAWALETSTDLTLAIAEMFRVLRPGGLLCLAFCADQPPRGVMDWIISRTLQLRGTGRFLSVRGVTALIEAQGSSRVVSVPLTGPVATVIAQRAQVEGYSVLPARP